MASGHDMKAANETYSGFVTIVKYSSIVAAVATAFVVFLLA